MDILTQTIPYPVQIEPESALAAFQIFLHRYLQQERVVVVFPCVGEPGVTLSVVMTDLTARQKFEDVVAQVRQTLETEKIPWDGESAEAIESAPRFQVAFHFHDGNQAPPYLLAGNLPGTILELECIHSGKSLETHWYYNQAWYKTDEVVRMAACFGVFLQNLLAAPDGFCASIPLLTAEEQQAWLVDWNHTAAEYPREATIHGLIEDQVDRTPEAVAATFSGQKITYAELEKRANRVARALLAVGIQPGTPVGLFIERDLDMLAAQIGILKAGAAYAALDTQYPRELLARLFGIIDLPVILTQSHLVEKLPEHKAKVLLLDDLVWLSTFADTRPDNSTSAGDPAFIIFTSGSTGLPKGVIHTHRNMVARFHAAWDLAALTACDVVSQTSPLSSIDGVDEIFSPLMRGARVVMIPHRVVTDPHSLVATLESEGVTRIILVPSLLRIILALEEVDLDQRLRKLATWLIGGEPLTNAMAHMFYQRLPHARLINFYGLTEGDALYHLVRPQVDYPVAPPIGRPVQNAKVYLLDEYLNPVPVGVAGEICIASEGLFREYDRRPDLNSQKWVPNPFVPADDPFYARLFKTGDIGRLTPAGDVEYVGRRDRMVKIRSFRVELGEIEAALYRHPSVKECVVVAREMKPTASTSSSLTRQIRLVGYVVPAPENTATPQDLRQFLRDLLPDYAMPAAIVLLEKLPLSPNGKVDVAALPEISEAIDVEENFVAPRDPLEVEIADMWSALLQRHPVGVNDNFFDIGGDSLAAVDLVLQIEKKFRQSLPISVLLQSPTVGQLAAMLRNEGRQVQWSSLVPIQPKGNLPPLFVSMRMAACCSITILPV